MRMLQSAHRRDMPSPALQIARDRARWDPSTAADARAHFDAHHWVKIRGFLSGALLREVQDGIRRATFVDVRHDAVDPPSIDVCMEPNVTSAMLELLCNDPALLRAVEAITGCAPLTRFSGFVYRLTPGTGHHHNWHNDMVQHRRVAMSINLEAEPYEGGVLQIRVRETEQVIEEVENVGAGDAVLFRIDAAMQHRAMPVTAGVKTAFAGWFRSSASFREELEMQAANG
jgi:hypothetical protein